ncbi:MAG: ABC transporter permease [Acidobacteria bacterium]|nr:ABC transporter permease [Acidobacteriota bacterium]
MRTPRILSDIAVSLGNLRAQKTRTFLTALGIVFGVGSVIGMLAIGEGAKVESLRFIEQLGVRNVLIESRPAMSAEELQQRRRNSPGLTERDIRVIRANLEALEVLSPRKSMHPQRVIPKPAAAVPELYGVSPDYASIHSLKLTEGTFFTPQDEQQSTAVCVLGEKAKISLLGYGGGVGQHVKVNDTWLEVVGVLSSRIASPTAGGAGSHDINNVIYVPYSTFEYRYFDRSREMRDDIDGVDVRLKPSADSIDAAKIVTAILNSTHHNTEDFTVTIPAALLAQQQQTQKIFTYVMVAIAAISLLVGGIGIMNIVLATVLERTREIGIRRATGARRRDILRQFLLESILISVGGGLLGITFGFGISHAIATWAEWETVVTSSSIVIAFGVSVLVGVVFGIYPALKAARIDPIEALRYE